MLLYGEFGFVLLGLKPCMLIEFRDEKTNQLYYTTVIEPVLHAMNLHNLKLRLLQNIRSPEADLHGCLLLYNQANSALVENMFQSSGIVSESDMARLLDYPGHLPSSPEEIQTMKLVLYFHLRPNKSLLAVTSFAIQESEKQATQSHFERYKRVCQDRLGIELKLLVQ
ncbi:hypothetical protein K501DRAFT_255089 [Backusella circina FSU 941]|nr:hypothetical protein K501DRAFT_255089 [Backusella circina FSU 941]